MGRQTFLTYENQTRSIAAWARHLGVGAPMLMERLRQGWPLADVLSTPARPSQAPPQPMAWCPTHEHALVRDITGANSGIRCPGICWRKRRPLLRRLIVPHRSPCTWCPARSARRTRGRHDETTGENERRTFVGKRSENRQVLALDCQHTA